MNNINGESSKPPLIQREIHTQKLLMRTNGFSIIMRGVIDDANPELYLIPFLDKVHKNILEQGIMALEIDISQLEYINSSGIKDLITWLLKFDSIDSALKYDITFLCDKQSRWQGLSIAMIQKIIPDNIFIKFI